MSTSGVGIKGGRGGSRVIPWESDFEGLRLGTHLTRLAAGERYIRRIFIEYMSHPHQDHISFNHSTV